MTKCVAVALLAAFCCYHQVVRGSMLADRGGSCHKGPCVVFRDNKVMQSGNLVGYQGAIAGPRLSINNTCDQLRDWIRTEREETQRRHLDLPDGYWSAEGRCPAPAQDNNATSERAHNCSCTLKSDMLEASLVASIEIDGCRRNHSAVLDDFARQLEELVRQERPLVDIPYTITTLLCALVNYKNGVISCGCRESGYAAVKPTMEAFHRNLTALKDSMELRFDDARVRYDKCVADARAQCVACVDAAVDDCNRCMNSTTSG